MKSGVYQMCYRGLSMAEARRLGRGPFGFLIIFLSKLVGRRGGLSWLPAHESERPCSEADLTPTAMRVFMPVVSEARRLGYTDGCLSVMSVKLDRTTKEAFGYFALHQDKRRMIFIGYSWYESDFASNQVVAISGNMEGLDGIQYDFVDHAHYFDPLPITKKIYVRDRGLNAINDAMLKHLKSCEVKAFADYAEMKRDSDEGNMRLWDERVARGLYVFKRPSAYTQGTQPPELPR